MTISPEAPFDGASALIFGGGQNIGRAVVLEWVRRGARVAVADRNFSGCEEVAAEVRGMGGEAVALACDVTSDEAVAAAVAAAEAAFGPLDIVMNNAGIIAGGNPQDIPIEVWRETLDVNLLGAVRSINLVLPGMLARGRGHIVNTASFAGLFPYAANRVHYAASKAALISLSENLAIYAEPMGVRVTCLCPGPVLTTIAEGMKDHSGGAPMRMPGAGLTLRLPEEVATMLADAMRDGKVLVPTDDLGWDFLRAHGAGPDAFLAAKQAEFAAGDFGRPIIPEGLLSR